MLDIAHSKTAMTVAVVAAVLWALGSVLAGLGYAILGSFADVGTSNNLVIAGAWLTFVGAFAALGATAEVAWHLFVTRQWQASREAGGAALSTLVFTIGFLIMAMEALRVSLAADVISAIGLGGWGVLLIVSAARRALLEQDSPGIPRQSELRLAGAASIFVLAVGLGLPTPAAQDSTLAISIGAIYVLGFSGLAVVLLVAHRRHMIVTRQFEFVDLGLWILVAAWVADTIASGIVFGPPPHSFLSIRVGLSIPLFVAAVGYLVLGWGAWGRVRELSSVGERGSISPTSSQQASEPVRSAELTATAGLPPPSWHPDPSNHHDLRWWDGNRWTEHVLDGDEPSTDPIAEPD